MSWVSQSASRISTVARERKRVVAPFRRPRRPRCGHDPRSAALVTARAFPPVRVEFMASSGTSWLCELVLGVGDEAQVVGATELRER